MDTTDTGPRDTRGASRFRDFLRAYRKARQWRCSWVPATIVATRFALTGDTGLFTSWDGWGCSRIYRSPRR